MENFCGIKKVRYSFSKDNPIIIKCLLCCKKQCYNCLLQCASMIFNPLILDVIKNNKVQWNFHNSGTTTQDEFIFILALMKVSKNLSQIWIC